MPERVLCTGGAGYIGSVLVPRLLQNGYHVRVLDTFRHGITLTRCLDYEGFDPVRGDCRDEELIKRCLKDVDWVIPLAAIVGAPACEVDKVGATQINRVALDLMMSLVSRGQRVLFPNSNSGYGTTQEGEVSTEDSPLNPLSTYARTKLEGELAVLSKENGISFRLATVFGPSPRMRLDLLVNDFVYRAVKDRGVVIYESHFRRNYMYIGDVVRLFLFGLNNFDKLKSKKVFNAGFPGCFTKKDLCQEIRKEVPNFRFFEAATGHDPDRRDYNISVDRLKQVGFESIVGLDQGIKELVKLYQMLPPLGFSNA